MYAMSKVNFTTYFILIISPDTRKATLSVTSLLTSKCIPQHSAGFVGCNPDTDPGQPVMNHL